jgi:hypothetical protein
MDDEASEGSSTKVEPDLAVLYNRLDERDIVELHHSRRRAETEPNARTSSVGYANEAPPRASKTPERQRSLRSDS